MVWVKTEAKGKSMPLDPEPARHGNVVLVPLPQTRHFVARVLPPEQLPPADGGPAYLSHFVTCRGGRPPRTGEVFTSDCQLCIWSFEGKSKRAVRFAFDVHYESDHADRCPRCNERLRPIRTAAGDLIWLDPEPVDSGDLVLRMGALVGGEHQLLAHHVERDTLMDTTPAYRVHDCQGVGRG